MKVKKLFLLSLASLMCVYSFSSCNNNSTEDSSDSESEVPVEESSEPEKTYPEYWGFSDYNITENAGAPEEITSYETIITRKPTASAWGYVSEYLFECDTEAGRLYTTFHETKWGTFNLGMYYLIDKDGVKHQLVEGYTDLEYVHIANGVWSGGNHGNEALMSLELYNGETGEKIELKNGERAAVNVLHIIEKTKLLCLPNPTSVRDDISGYTDNDVYAEVTRKYTVTGPQIKLNVDYKYVKDTNMSRSYNGMFPVTKEYGLTCEMYNTDGEMIRKIVTPKENSSFKGDLNEGNNASRAVMYGYADPRYQFDVRVNTITDSLDDYKGDYKTAFWDMSTSNKLYFTKYNNNTATRVKAGEEFHTECIWLFRFVPDAE